MLSASTRKIGTRHVLFLITLADGTQSMYFYVLYYHTMGKYLKYFLKGDWT